MKNLLSWLPFVGDFFDDSDEDNVTEPGKASAYTDEQLVPLPELEQRLKTSFRTGLTDDEAAARLAANGPNALTPPQRQPEWVKFLRTMFSGFASLLWVAGILCLVAYGMEVASADYDVPPDNLYIAGALLLVVFFTGIFTYYQQRKSSRIMESFARLIPPTAEVLRSGQVASIEARFLVVGDIVHIKGGDKVPADLRIIAASSLQVDNSGLTGESKAVSLSPESSDPNLLEARNMAFFSTSVIQGNGRGIVVQTGDNTIMGNIAHLVSNLNSGGSPIKKELVAFVMTITLMATAIGISFGIISLALGNTLIRSIIFVIGIIVANVPEGLLMTVTMSLTLAAQRMAAKNCLVKSLEAVEALGSTSVICTDKTGTLTQNKMTVVHMWFNRTLLSLPSEEGHYGEGFPKDASGWPQLARVAVLCSRAQFLKEDRDKPIIQRHCSGDASEVGILKCYEVLMGDSEAVRGANPKRAEIPFNSKNKYQVSVHDLDKSGRYLLVFKGAPELVFNRCSSILTNGEDVAMTEAIHTDFQEAFLQMANLGERVLAFADLQLNPADFPPGFKFVTEGEPNLPLQNLRFIGLMGMVDPPKGSVPEAVRTCRHAGIKVVMVTGDHPVTAAAIAKQVNIISADSQVLNYEPGTPLPETAENVAAVISGKVLAEVSADYLHDIITRHWEIVFARTSPQQKLRIVEAFQDAGAVVAVTGDGVNDSPALKKANIGISMGISGSEVSKESAELVLLDDNFSTIVVGVEEGRRIFDNLKKSIVYVITSAIPELTPFMAWATLGLPLPLSTILMLFIDLGTDMFPAISLAYEAAEPDVMHRPPRNAAKDRLVNSRLLYIAYGLLGVAHSVGGFFLYFVVMAQYGWWPSRLLSIRGEWDNESNNALEDSYGQEWSMGQRGHLLATCNSAFFFAIVQMQWANLIITKTRQASIVQQGMNNWMLNGALVVETILAAILIYTPVIPQYLGIYPLELEWWVVTLPFSGFLIFWDEMRRLLIRRSNKISLGQYLRQETIY